MLAPIPPPAAYTNDMIFKIGDSTTSLFCRDLGAVAHYEERRAYERLGKRAASGPNMDTWAALGICRFRDAVGNVAQQLGLSTHLQECMGSNGRVSGGCHSLPAAAAGQ